jgi:hypothetical protein
MGRCPNWAENGSSMSGRRAVTLKRRGVLGTLAATVALSAAPAYAQPEVKLTVIYVGAKDCPPCEIFNHQDRPQWDRSDYPSQIRFVAIDAPTVGVAYNARYWPTDLRFVLTQIKSTIVPTFILLNGRKIIMIGTGIGGWRAQVLPHLPGMLSGEWFRNSKQLQ